MAEYWEDLAFLLTTSPLGERDALVELLTQERGRIRSVARFGATSKHRATFQPGNLLAVEWKARQATQMGHIQAELQRAYFAYISTSALKLEMMQAATALCVLGLYDHDPAPALFTAMLRLAETLVDTQADREAQLKAYILFEQTLLSVCGFGLDLSRCGATGITEELVYISPRTGRAVSREAGLPYHDKLFTLPACLLDSDAVMTEPALAEALRLGTYFLERRLCEQAGFPLPEARQRLEARLAASATAHAD